MERTNRLKIILSNTNKIINNKILRKYEKQTKLNDIKRKDEKY